VRVPGSIGRRSVESLVQMKIDPALVKQLRLRRAWSQETLAEKAGLHPRTVQRVESHGVASLQTRLALATALDIDPAELERPGGEAPPTMTEGVETPGPRSAVQVDAARSSAPGVTAASARETRLPGVKGTLLVVLNMVVVVLSFGFVIVDQIYAYRLARQLQSAEMARSLSGVADFFLQFGLLTLPITIGAIYVAWRYRWVRILLIASVAGGLVLEAVFAATVSMFLPALWVASSENHAGMLLRFLGHATAVVCAFWAWIEFVRVRARDA
jgi:DNA-binding XRE family transcriptional regulator